MKTAKERAVEFREALGNGLRYDLTLTTGKSLLETLIEETVDDALEHAAEIVKRRLVDDTCCVRAIKEAARDVLRARTSGKKG